MATGESAPPTTDSDISPQLIMSFVLGVDVGTSRVRCVAVDHSGNTLSQRESSVQVIHPSPDASEIDPEKLWLSFKKVILETLQSASLRPEDASCLGITTLRATFLLWERETGRPLCNFSTWQDRRTVKECTEWNQSVQMKTLQAGANIAHFFTRDKRFMAASVMKFMTNHVTIRLWCTLNQISGSRERARRGELCFGTVDTWLIWKLTNGRVHATDYSNVSATAFYDTYQLEWSGLLLKVFDFPSQMLPQIRDSGGSFGVCDETILGAPIPITGIISDQTSATFAQMCWEPGDVKCTMGTGMFVNINTGRRPHASMTGFYPVIGWKIGDDLNFLAEGMFSSIGSVIEWGMRFGFYSNPAETEEMALSVTDSCGVCFVPCFDGIQTPQNDPNSTASIIGITHNTRKEHIVRAILEAIAFVSKLLVEVANSELSHPVKRIRVDGGVCRNNFILQLMSDLLGIPIEKPTELDQTVFGAVYIAGLASGFWQLREQVRDFWTLEKTFVPHDSTQCQALYSTWQEALQRSLHWYNSEKKN